jgi:hypothetical protein
MAQEDPIVKLQQEVKELETTYKARQAELVFVYNKLEAKREELQLAELVRKYGSEREALRRIVVRKDPEPAETNGFGRGSQGF